MCNPAGAGAAAEGRHELLTAARAISPSTFQCEHRGDFLYRSEATRVFSS
jgi:hypothetical protein